MPTCAEYEKGFVASFFFKVSINHLFDNLESGKRNYCLEKKHEKSLEFWIQESVRALSEWQINLSKLEGKGDEQGNSINEMVHSFDFFCVHAPLNITGWWYHVESCTEQPLFLFWAKLHLFTISWMPFLGFPSFSPTQFNKQSPIITVKLHSTWSWTTAKIFTPPTSQLCLV